MGHIINNYISNNMLNLMKKHNLLLILIAFVLFFTPNYKLMRHGFINADTLPSTKYYNCYKYTKPVPHFFTHQMINNASLAFSSKNPLRYHYDKDCITSKEFFNFLNEMYNNNYVLIDIYSLIGYNKGLPYLKEVYVPFGKKPFVFSFDDMSYDSKGLGLSDKIILDDNGNLASFTESNENKIEYDKESICVLENFIKQHPDFSFDGARAVICPTGYNGILGYRINKGAKNRESEIKQIKPLISKLKKLGYRFGCHTYNHINVKNVSNEKLLADLQKYENEIVPIIGKTDIYCFPCGNYVQKGYKMNLLKKFGYKIFFCVGMPVNSKEYNESVFFSRKTLDGNSMRNFHNNYAPFFDTYNMYDNENRFIKIKRH